MPGVTRTGFCNQHFVRDMGIVQLQLEPGLTASALRRLAPIFDEKLMNAYVDDLRQAGLPE